MSESGYPGLEDSRDYLLILYFVRIRIYRIKGCTGLFIDTLLILNTSIAIFNIYVQNPDNPQILDILIQTNMNKKKDRSFEVNVARE